MIIVDTSVMVEIADKSAKGEQLEEYIRNSQDNFAITVFTVHELLLPTSEQEKEKLKEKLYGYNVLPFDNASSLESVNLNNQLKNKGAVLSKIDLFIASICKVQNASFLTLDSDFKRVSGLKLVQI